jgi:hypothetical protein
MLSEDDNGNHDAPFETRRVALRITHRQASDKRVVLQAGLGLNRKRLASLAV